MKESLLKEVSTMEQEMMKLSRDKWIWMAEKNIEELDRLFHEQAVFVHIGGAMTKEEELNVIENGIIHYQEADIEEASVEFMGDTAILLNKIRLTAVVSGNEVVNLFVVTEVYLQQADDWTLGAMSFTELLED